MSKTWKIPVTWEMCGTVDVVADTLEEAYDFVQEDPMDIPLPDEKYFVDDSFRPSFEKTQLAEIEDIYNSTKEYVVCAKIKGCVELVVNETSLENALKEAEKQISESDFGPLSDVTWNIHSIEG